MQSIKVVPQGGPKPTTRKQLVENIQEVYEELLSLKGELDEEMQLNSGLQEQVESFFGGHYGIKFCSTCKKKYTPLNNNAVVETDPESLSLPPGTAKVLPLQRLRGRRVLRLLQPLQELLGRLSLRQSCACKVN